MTMRERLKCSGARTDGLCWDRDGNLVFVATNAGGPWSEEQKSKVRRALGRSERLPSSSDFTQVTKA